MSILYYILSFFVIINIIVFVHEYGHFLAAKRVGVKVSKFSIGIGPEIFGFDDKHGTHWCFSLLPVGGYVMMLGDGDIASSTEDEESLAGLSEEEKQQSFLAKNNWEKMLIMFCGPFFNYIYAFVVIFFMSILYGTPTYEPVVGKVLKDSPAEKAGILEGDRIISVDDQKVEKYRDIILKIMDNESGKIKFLVERIGTQQEIFVTPEIKEEKESVDATKKTGIIKKLIDRRGKTKLIGIGSGAPTFERKSIIEAVQLAFYECINTTKEMCSVFSKLFAGKKSFNDFGGIVRMAEVAGDLSKSGNFALLIMFTVTLSLNLGFINLFPLPVLDGGRILISFVEEVTGKKLNKTLQEYVMMACAILLIFLMLLTTINDVLRIEVVSKFVSNVVG
ncbi:MAG: site-2 protease family protein [Holosporaceae bacterium]|jgi:regulator of sigma E protease|nr:site-2 protease family protein [Holosporaceae bacterium]